MIGPSDFTAMTRSWKEKFSSISDRRVEDYYSDLSIDDDPKAPEPTPKDPTFGVDAVVKTFYEGKNGNANYYDWSETPPKQMSKKAARAQDRVAIKVYKIKDLEKPIVGGTFSLKFHMLEIQSPALVMALKDIVKKEDVHLEATEIATFKHPFRPLWFCMEQILALQRSTAEGTLLKNHLSLLVRLMGEIFGGMKTHLKNLQASGLISFKLSWTYFPKDSIVYSPEKDCERLYKVVDTEIKPGRNCRPVLHIKCKEISFDGEGFVWQNVTLQIPEFEGNRPITEMKHYPLSFHPNPEDVKARLTVRGKKVLEYQGLTYCGYSGLGIYSDDAAGCEDEKHNVSGRILIDTYGYNKHHLALKRREGKNKDSITNKVVDATDICGNINPSFPPPPPPPQTMMNGLEIGLSTSKLPPAPGALPEKADDYYIKRLNEEEQKKNKNEMLAREKDLFYLSPMLVGYALKNKLWLSFYVDDIQPVIWNDEAYSHLVYPEEQKDLVLSFVENHKRTRQGSDDVIMGKGQGLILLLSGPPGTGKTLTAEAVADKTRRPLYYLQAEDLGINAAVLGSRIKKVFEMATEWDAVILLDEADVFMAERNPNDIARNELVSIFLREIEYFRGIIFLTTNLYDTIDTAFRSRVNIHLLFNPLPPASRLVLWSKFLDRLTPIQGRTATSLADLDDDDLKELAKWELNGREIKNAIKTVKSWCDCKDYDMSLSRLESGIKVTAPQAKKRELGDSGLYD